MPLSLIFWKPLWPNFRKGGMKKVLEEEIVAKSNYATITRICVAESSGAKTSFWPKVLEILKKADFDESGAPRKASGKLRDGSAT